LASFLSTGTRDADFSTAILHPPTEPLPARQGCRREVVSVHPKDILGRLGEEIAVKHLRAAGYAVVARNWRCDVGEIDIVARERDTLVVCEVKTRSGVGFGTPLEAVTDDKAARLRRLASRYVDAQRRRPKRVRVDVIGVLCRPDEAPVVDHVRGAA
jgi:putative endonuclease